jgi:hypothetical protein
MKVFQEPDEPKQPGQVAWEAFVAALSITAYAWRDVMPDNRAAWAAVEHAIRSDERARISGLMFSGSFRDPDDFQAILRSTLPAAKP